MNKVAETILNQIGGNKFIVMTGAKNFVASSDALSFSIGKNKSKANRVVITLTAADLYNVEFWKVSPTKGTCETLEIVNGAYFDQLENIFTSTTGLLTKLGA